jgi:hypothetical protein
MLSPLGVLRSPDIRASCSPSAGKLVGVFDEQIRRGRCRGQIGWDHPQMDLATIESGEAVAAALVRAGCEAKSVVMLQGDAEVTDRKYWGDPLRGNRLATLPSHGRDRLAPTGAECAVCGSSGRFSAPASSGVGQ